MSVVRVHELPDGSVVVTIPATASRGTIERTHDYLALGPADHSLVEGGALEAWIAAVVDDAHRDAIERLPGLAGAPFRAEYDLQRWQVEDDPVRAKVLDDGAPKSLQVRLIFSLPEPEADWLTRVFARAVESQPHLDGLPYFDVDPTSLPDRTAPCTDGCGEEHPVRHLWQMRGEGGARRVHVDTAQRNVHAELRHLDHAVEHELTKDTPDGSRLATIDAARRSLARHHREGGAAPRREMVSDLTADALKEKRAGRSEA